MKRLLILWLLLPLLSAAKVPVESDIKARIEDPASEQYYPVSYTHLTLPTILRV